MGIYKSSTPQPGDEEMDPTESARRQMLRMHEPTEREALEAQYGEVLDTRELMQDYTVKSFLAPFVMVVRKSDGVSGCMMFQHSPRYYYDFQSTEG